MNIAPLASANAWNRYMILGYEMPFDVAPGGVIEAENRIPYLYLTTIEQLDVDPEFMGEIEPI